MTDFISFQENVTQDILKLPSKEGLINHDEKKNIYETLHTLSEAGQLDDYLKLIENTTEGDKIKDIIKTYKSIQNTSHLYDMAEDEIAPMLYSRSSLYLSINLVNKKIDALIDTGAETNIISKKIVDELGLNEYVDISQQGNIKGVGTSRSHGMIPYLEIRIDDISCPLCFTVLDTSINIDMIIGLPFMQFYNINLNFEKRVINIMGKDIKMFIKDH